ncbi:MAG: hypothetical protein J6R64_04550, partial [Lentisphaeria bacterium]|nr:hypothetical protein [Lentisphaeria bacterium]
LPGCCFFVPAGALRQRALATCYFTDNYFCSVDFFAVLCYYISKQIILQCRKKHFSGQNKHEIF